MAPHPTAILQGTFACPTSSSITLRNSSHSVQRLQAPRSYGLLLKARREVWLCGGGVSLQRRGVLVSLQGIGRRRELVVRCNESDEVDNPPEAPAYTSYVDPNTGEASPTYGARTALPGPAYWGEDMQRVVRSGQASTPRGEARGARREYVSKRKNSSVASREAERKRVENEFEEAEEEEEEEDEEFVPRTKEEIRASGGDLWYTKNDPEHDPIKEQLYQMVEEHEEEKRERAEENYGGDDDAGTDVAGLVGQDEGALVPSAETDQLTNNELWWNWQKPSKEKEPWSAWHKRSGDSDSVMAAGMAKSGQIRLFGEKPTIAEASLARARKRVFYEERMREEESRRKKVGAVAYYKEWVKAWRQDTSKEAVEEKKKNSSEGVVDQLLDMLQHQSLKEYRKMQGTDIRIARDPLTMRMPEEEMKQVWGGDPVYPTINYEQDPDCVADFRNANMHEPTPDILEQLRDDNILITQEELQELLAKEEREAQELEGGSFDDGMTGAIDIGDKEDDEDDEEDEEDDEEDDDFIGDDIAWKQNISNQNQLPTGKPKANREAKKFSPVIDLLDQIDGSDLLEYVGSGGDDEDEGEDYIEDLEN
ncbi:hypothetical protein KC19_1G122200 [Ceratodon purpureus]|uniref:Uncharacterized protein n=1 Tax=Ceratodon purpureus TaxID=3225 RepID=A0A8T0J6X5_CERPU|nr:hypothetical protein KC19_1G122200 [Ceratodon purpureus]